LLSFTDLLYRPKELDSEKGGGVSFSQAARQIEVGTMIGRGRNKSVRASTGSSDDGWRKYTISYIRGWRLLICCY
jgi:hypothetical protein